MSSLIALLAVLVTSQPESMIAPPDTSAPVTSVAALPERLVTQRTRLHLSDGQVARLRSLADKYRFQEGQDRVSSKSWLPRAPSLTEARAEVLRGLSAEQRRLAAPLVATTR